MNRQDIDAFDDSDFTLKNLFQPANSKAFQRYPVAKPELLNLSKYGTIVAYFLKYFSVIWSILE
jgi:hypothetical protein